MNDEDEARAAQMIARAIDAWERTWQTWGGPDTEREKAASRALIAAIRPELELAQKIFFIAHKIMDTVPAVRMDLAPMLPAEWIWDSDDPESNTVA